MVTIFNKSNRPIGIGKQSVLPDREIKVKDKEVFCEVFDENGAPTGKKQILPGLKALEMIGFVTIKVDEEPKPEPKPEEEKKAEEPVAEEKPKAKKGRKPKEE